MRKGENTGFGRRLRRDMTDAERALWWRLRYRQVDGCRFRRQHPIGPYIADFACLELTLVVELDGGQHADAATDRVRDAWLRRHGWDVMRFWNHDVLQQPVAVAEAVLLRLRKRRPHPGLPPQAGEGDRPRRPPAA